VKRTPLERRTPLASRSRKRATLYRDQRVPIVRALLAEHPTCQRCHTAPAVDVHELKSRARGGSITDPANLTTVCRPCHDWITTHPADAEATGWALPSWA